MESSIADSVNSLVIFHSFAADETLAALAGLERADGGAPAKAYSDFAASLLSRADTLGELLRGLLSRDDNIYVRRYLSGTLTPALDALLEWELGLISQLSEFDISPISEKLGAPSAFESDPFDAREFYHRHLKNIHDEGFGAYAAHTMFVPDRAGVPVPVGHPDGQRLCDLVGYENERSKIVANTLALLERRPAANVLLYGDAGTGKSSTVKAIANEYAGRGLRLIDLKKDRLHLLPSILDSLAGNPLSFIIFIDDLSFDSDDGDFCSLKAVLEGGADARPANTVIYVTSNHRHLVKERVSDRGGDEISTADKMQEIVSLSARFALCVTFLRPDRDLYCSIVRALAERAELVFDDHALLQRAEAFAIRHGGRNPRTARHFVELLCAGVEKL